MSEEGGGVLRLLPVLESFMLVASVLAFVFCILAIVLYFFFLVLALVVKDVISPVYVKLPFLAMI